MFLAGVVIDLELPSYTVNEANGTVEVCATIVSGTLERSVVVTISTSDGTATGESFARLSKAKGSNKTECICFTPKASVLLLRQPGVCNILVLAPSFQITSLPVVLV